MTKQFLLPILFIAQLHLAKAQMTASVQDCYEEYLIYNLQGELIQQGEIQRGKKEVDVSSLLQGVYVMKLIGEESIHQMKLIKE